LIKKFLTSRRFTSKLIFCFDMKILEAERRP